MTKSQKNVSTDQKSSMMDNRRDLKNTRTGKKFPDGLKNNKKNNTQTHTPNVKRDTNSVVNIFYGVI